MLEHLFIVITNQLGVIMMGRLTNKVAIITGGASGMGREMVDLFTKEGAQVIAADINEKAVAVVNELDNVH